MSTIFASKQIVVLGMHRSGTSAATGLLGACGAHIGSPEELTKPVIENPKGFFERRDARAICDALLHSAEADWWKVREFEVDRIPPAALAEQEKKIQALVAELDSRGTWALKEPRISVLLPVFRRFLKRPVGVFVVRNPVEVAKSLRRRNGFTRSAALALWEAYVIAALRHSADLPRVFLSYAELVSDPAATTKRLKHDLERLGVVGLRDGDPAEVIDPSLHREQASNADDGSLMTAEQRWLWDHLSRGKAPTADLLSLSSAARFILEDFEIDHTDALKRARKQVDASRLKEAEANLAEAKLAETTREFDRLAVSLKERDAHAAELAARLEVGKTAVRELTAEVKKQEAHATKLAAKLKEQEARATKLRKRTKTRENEVLKLKRSVSWRVTAPLRGVAGGLQWTERSIRRVVKALRLNDRGEPGPNEDIPSDSNISSAAKSGLTVLVPVFNALSETIDCLRSVVSHRLVPYNVIILDDCSSDKRVKETLSKFAAEHHFVRYIRNERNLGYTANVNKGLRLASAGDVILLNSDTVVTSGWAEKLAAAAYSRDNVATVTPLSNAAGAFSIPENNAVNTLLGGLGPDDYNSLLEAVSNRQRPEVPTGNGYCLYITRCALDRLKEFNQNRFPRGYGEENDFCQRAIASGLVNLIDDATFIFHHRSASFGGEKDALLEQGRAMLTRLHPGYGEAVRTWLLNDELNGLRTRFTDRLTRVISKSDVGDKPKPRRILYVIHDGSGGVKHTSNDLAARVGDKFSVMVLRTAPNQWCLWEYVRGKPELVRLYNFPIPWAALEPLSSDRWAVLRGLTDGRDFALVHIRHFIGNAPELVSFFKERDVPVVVSLHDFYVVCPTIQLLDENSQYCGGTCTESNGNCPVVAKWFLGGVPGLKHGAVYTHRARMEAELRKADALVTTSKAAHDVVLRNLPSLKSNRFEIIEHGRDLAHLKSAAPIRPHEPIRIISFGALGRSKGVKLLEELVRRNSQEGHPFEFHFLGTGAGESVPLKSLGGITHGPYEREDLPAKLRAIRPSLALVLSIWPETYCHTLSEAWAAGLPVIASDIGTLRERVNRHGGGWLVDYSDAERCWEQLTAITRDPAAHAKAMEDVAAISLPTTAEMARDYLEMYRALGVVEEESDFPRQVGADRLALRQGVH